MRPVTDAGCCDLPPAGQLDIWGACERHYMPAVPAEAELDDLVIQRQVS
ncbi:hypothetical protein [Stutzerimonas chloritidismutans]|nr:hypothetical protein [Stutzerimonas chloritidismutans]